MLRSAGLPWDLRKTEPYLGYETYEFEVPTATEGDSFARYLLRLEEMRQSLRIVTQALDRLEPGPVMVEDRKIAWPAQLALGPDGLGNSLDHVKKIMGQSMESLIHHFKLVTEGFRVPPGQVTHADRVAARAARVPRRVRRRDATVPGARPRPRIRQPAGDAGDGGGRPARRPHPGARLIDPVMGGVDR